MTETKQENQEGQFMIQRIYVKDLSFETKNTPSVFQQQWEPELSVDLNTSHSSLGGDVYEVVLSITATVMNKKTTAFLVEIKQAGIFTISGAAASQLDQVLGSFCPNILYPYAREVITSQVVNGSFPQLVLAPINFDALYMKQLEDKQNAGAGAANEETSH